ncbi:MAG TPA: DUF4350 domain-containing protein [Myxococcales bacterium]
MKKRASLAAWYALALCFVAGAAVALRSGETRQAESPIPSIENPDARGAKGLFTYLAESGAAPGVLSAPITRLPADAKVVLAIAPTNRPISQEEMVAIGDWVGDGNTFVYGVPRRVRTQYVETFLSLKWIFGVRPAPLIDTEGLDEGLRAVLAKSREKDDPTGTNADPWLPHPLLSGVKGLRVAADDGLESAVSRARAIAGEGEAPAVLVIGWGKGEFVLLAGSDLAENRRLALGDNLQFWANLASRGRVYFDEYHHQPPEETGRGLLFAIGPTILQLLLGAAVLALALGRRLGQARPLSAGRRRSQGEYVSQLAQLYQASRVEPELCAELHHALRRTLFDRMGISAKLDEQEVARRLEQRTQVKGERYLALARRAREAAAGSATPEQYAKLSRDYALFQREIGC